MSSRTYEEDVAYWFGDVAGLPDAYLPHLTNQEIQGLSDSYDDGRIDTLIYAYIELRDTLDRIKELIND